VKPYTYLAVIILVISIGLYLISCNDGPHTASNNIAFKSKLSAYGLFESDMAYLRPAEEVEIIDISSPLFTDYAEKQRILKIPADKKVMLNGNGLPIFPEGSIIAKTFYYSKAKDSRRQIIETRLLILADKKWNAATYRWNAAQTDADLLVGGAVVPITFSDTFGRNRNIAYKIPSQNDCGSCHRSGNELVPIGPKAQQLHVTVNRDGMRQNQLAYLMNKGIFKQADITSITALPDYNDTSLPLPKRARAYLEMNCAHCHQSSGMAANTSLNLPYSTPFHETGIDFNKQNILVRMRVMGEYHMPKTGTTILDDEGVKLVTEYISSLRKPSIH
jgi:uncharacterized repeat protein (TIGR03806 family)